MSGEVGLDATIKALFRDVLGVAPEAVDDTTRRGVVEQWDSLGHLNLVAALSEAFKIDISAEQALDLETVRDIKRLVTGLDGNGPPP